MKRGLKALCKYFFVSIFTIILTIIVFNFFRSLNDLPNSSKSDLKGIQPREEIWAQHLISEDDDDKKKIDWHDYEQIAADLKRKGVGEQGAGTVLDFSIHDRKMYEELYSVNGFNAYLSDLISVNRSVKDIRHKSCQKKKYLAKLPTVSVVVPYHNEHWSTLLRTVYSVINRSPKSLLKEIILVDDFSSKAHCKGRLDKYMHYHLKGKVKVIHLPKRSGLIRARLAGAKEAKAEVLIFLDSHSEANVNWLPPLLEPIAENYKTCVCPFIDVISFEEFEYRAQDEGARGAFDWELFYKRLPLLPEDLKHPSEPFKSPIMAGGLFAISAKFFWELGGYDPGLDIWGGEQYELSFKIWQCGGQMLDAPCSRVGHIYRKYSPFPNPGFGDFLGKNYRRVAEVWMDEYAQYIYARRPHYKAIDPGDLTKQREIRTRLKCKPFKWFIKNIAFDLIEKYPPVEPPDFAWGQISNYVLDDYCIDMENKVQSSPPITLRQCWRNSSNKKKGLQEQEFRLTFKKDIMSKKRNMCLDVSDSRSQAPVGVFTCHGSQGNQLFRYRFDTKWILHGNNQRCLDTNSEKKNLFLASCDEDSKTQMWKITHVNETALELWDQNEKSKEL